MTTADALPTPLARLLAALDELTWHEQDRAARRMEDGPTEAMIRRAVRIPLERQRQER